MKNSCFTFVILVSFHIAVDAKENNAKADQAENQKAELTKRLHSNGMCFTPNKGQIADMNGKLRPDVLYRGEGNGSDIYLRKTGISYVFNNMDEVIREVHKKVEEMELYKEGLGGKTEGEWQQELMQKEYRALGIKVHQVDMDFVNCLPAEALAPAGNACITTINEGELDGYNNYYYAHCPNGILNVKQYNKVTYKNIYNNIDITYHGSKEQGIKYDIIVQPHADPGQIRLKWSGAEDIHLNREGHSSTGFTTSLVIKTSVNEFIESIPKVYQLINGKVIDVAAEYKLSANGIVSFSFGEGWDEAFPLVIDPWATYYGGTGADYGTSVACDNSGSVYLAGYTNSAAAIATAGGFQTVYGGGLYDAFLVKFNSATGVRNWATYYGGTGWDRGNSVACDNAGNVYLTGWTSTNTSTAIATATGVQTVFGGGEDAFLVKFDPTGARDWGTYYGGTGNDWGNSVACDNLGNVYLAGMTSSPNTGNVMATATGFQTVHGGGFYDAYLVKFNSGTGARIWGTYYGGTGADYGTSVACDNSGSVYLAGYTNSAAAIATASGFQIVFGGGTYDAFFVKFNSATGARDWATYYGGTGDDRGNSVACDNAGNVYLAGWTSTNTGTAIATATGFQTVFGGVFDSFLVKFNSGGGRDWGTYYGWALHELNMPGCLAIDGSNNVYLYMEIEDKPGPNLIDACAYQPNFAGGIEDQIIVKFNPAGKKLCATYFGGSGYEDLDAGGGIAVSGNLLFICAINGNGIGAGAVAGSYPVTAGAHQTVHGGSNDAVLACLCTNICEGKTLDLNYATSVTSLCVNAPVIFTPSVANSCDTTGYKYQWTFAGGTPASSTAVNPTVAFSGVGTHDVKLVLTTVCKKDSITKISYITVNPCGGITASVNSATICSGITPCPTLTAAGGNGTLPYTYSWSTGNTTQSINPCPASTASYTVEVTDAGGATSTTTATITVNAAVSVTISSTNLSCNGSTNGTATANPGSGTSPFTYNWSNAGTTQTITGLTQGNYIVTVTDKKGCAFSTTVALTSPAPLAGQFSKGTASCTGCGCKEWLMVNATGGTGPYSYSWPDGYVNRYKNQLCPGVYSINIKDKNGCSVNVNLTAP